MFSSCAGPRRGRSCWRRQNWISDGALCASWVGGPHPAPRRGRATRDGSRTDGMGPLRLAEKTPWSEVGRQAWNRRGEGSSTGGLAWSGPGPCLGAGQGRRGGRLSQRRDKPATHARWPARFRGVSVTWRDAPPRHGATALPGHPASVPPPDESSSPQRRPPQVRQLAAVTERSASRPEAGYQQTDPSEVSWAGLGWPQTWLAPQKS